MVRIKIIFIREITESVIVTISVIDTRFILFVNVDDAIIVSVVGSHQRNVGVKVILIIIIVHAIIVTVNDVDT